MHPYPDALNAMHDLLGALGEQHWRKRIAQDIDEWESHKSASHHLSAYGGMGSFKDIGFEDVWLGSLFDDLQSACYYFANHPASKPDINALERSMGTIGFALSGWRCLACGYGAVSHRDIEYFIACRVIRYNIVEEAGRTHLREFVASAIRSHPADPALIPAKVAGWAERSGLQIRDGNEWLRPCPGCGSRDTTVYRWLLADDAHRFVPSHDNLRLRTSAV